MGSLIANAGDFEVAYAIHAADKRSTYSCTLTCPIAMGSTMGDSAVFWIRPGEREQEANAGIYGSSMRNEELSCRERVSENSFGNPLSHSGLTAS